MKAIETTITVKSDRTATFQFPDDVSPGTHTAVILVEQDELPTSGKAFDWPTRDIGPWQANLSLRREDMYGDDGR